MDMLFQLNRLPSLEQSLRCTAKQGVSIRRAMAYERNRVIEWVDDQFGALWAAECAVAFGHQPVGCYIAVQSGTIRGFCCMESTYRNFLGPIGVQNGHQNNGIGRALVLSVLHDMHHSGYAYAVVGDVGVPGFFERVAGAREISGFTAGAYPEKLS